MNDASGVMIYAEAAENGLAGITAELMGIGRKLADELGEPLCAVLLGEGVSGLADDVIALGADKVFVVDDALLKDYQTDSHAIVMEKMASDKKPRIILLGQTAAARDLAPRLAFRLKTALAADCIDLSLDGQSLQATRPVYGGNALAAYTFEAGPQVATIRAKAFEAARPDSSHKGEIIKEEAGIDAFAIRTKIVDKVKAEVTGVQLEDADVVVAGGRGIGSAEGFKQLEELANLFGGAIGASRPPCDSGWAPEVCQIGITGKIIAPDIYFAVGLSGSSQHVSGCAGSKNIIAINKDPEANIFKVASYGIVGDWKKVIPAFTARVKEMLGK